MDIKYDIFLASPSRDNGEIPKGRFDSHQDAIEYLKLFEGNNPDYLGEVRVIERIMLGVKKDG